MAYDASTGELTRWLTRVEEKIDKAVDDHETRLRKVERIMYAGVGIAAMLGSGVGSLIGRALGG